MQKTQFQLPDSPAAAHAGVLEYAARATLANTWRNKMQLSDAIEHDLATLGWNAQPAGWQWCDYGWVCAWVDPEVVDLIEGRIEWEKA